VPAQVLHRCYDLGDLLAVAAAGQAEAAVVAATTRWLDRDALDRLAAAGLAVVGVAPAGDEDSERRLRQLGLDHVGADADPPATLLALTRAALAADPAPTPPAADPPPPADGETPHTLVAVWGPKGAPGRTTVAVNLAFEAAPLVGEVLLVDAETYWSHHDGSLSVAGRLVVPPCFWDQIHVFGRVGEAAPRKRLRLRSRLGADHRYNGGIGDAAVGRRQRGAVRHRHPLPGRGSL
jgi:hypothetical protein